MHELSLAMDVCRITEEHVGRDGLARVREVGLEVGDRSGVELGSFRFCLESLLGAEPFRGAVPNIRRTAGDELRVTYVEIEDGDPAD
ncbi:MAG: hydrogenase maturation nickel metallochaperone HypA [Gemmatimonadota bacterium]|nr:hydrogenase maturation nickel metallochaperone HypA [Gemmatimonadota bacterium]